MKHIDNQRKKAKKMNRGFLSRNLNDQSNIKEKDAHPSNKGSAN